MMISITRLLILATTLVITLAFAQTDSANTDANKSTNVDLLKSLLGVNLDTDNSADDGAFLHPDIAYVLSTKITSQQTIDAQWEMAKGYYLYRDKFKIKVKSPTDVLVGSLILPPGKLKQDPYFGDVEVYYDNVKATAQLSFSSSAPKTVEFEISYQGCADAGLCYPPTTKIVSLTVPSVLEQSTEAPSSLQTPTESNIQISNNSELPEQDRVAAFLSNSNLWIVIVVFFGFGLLLAFTPCMLPMVPILSSIIVGQGVHISTARAVSLSSTYVLAMALAYTAAGVAAGLSGANLQAVFQEPWILISFSAVFVLLALSMFGLYELQMPAVVQARLAKLSNSQQSGTFLGVGVMGILSALIVGPCIAVPLVGALMYISRSGDAVLGGIALFSMSIGMGTPLIMLGASAGKLLPRVGPWMSTINAVFGVLMLVVAIYFMERILPGGITLVLWGSLLVIVSIYMGALDSMKAGVSGWRRLAKGVGLVMMIYGAVLLIGAASGAKNPLQPLNLASLSIGTNSGSNQSIHFKPIKSIEDLQNQITAASQQNRTVMLDFYADWCISCKQMERFTFTDPGVKASLADTLLLQADVTANDNTDQLLLQSLGLFGPPAILFFGTDGLERSQYRVVGFMGAEDFREHVGLAFQ